MKKSIDQVDVEARFVLMRADFNVPVDDSGRITDERRIAEALPTIRHILGRDGRLILMSHFGRPEGRPDPRYSLAPVARRLGELLNQDVPLVEDYTGETRPEPLVSLRKGRAALLENLRFHPEETVADKDAERNPPLQIQKRQFARKLADLGEVYVNDAFGTCHRDNASMLTVPMLMADRPKVVGFLVQKELKVLGQLLDKPKRPFVCILGGAKVSDKIGLIGALLRRCDLLLIGGAMANTFLLARGEAVGDSRVEADKVEEAKRLLRQAGDKIRLPVDAVCASEIKEQAATQVCSGGIRPGLKGLDIGPRTLAGFADLLSTARTIFWNGPMGVFETPPFDHGTLQLAEAIARASDGGAISVVGGGDSAAAIIVSDTEKRITHVSTGGGACLEFLEGAPFRAIDILDNA
jgi:phosphoglycerate kinase